ncbi:MAG: YigZ family protein [Bacteroidales bacterium]|nr:YigZ family protein [Bacteroidales bacterium]
MFEDTYKTIRYASQGVYKEKGSKFLAFAYPIATEAEAKARLEELRKQYFDARHHCYAYILGADKAAYRINDDGEPSSTAGKPIYGQLLSHDLTNIIIVVVRYFGGIKLGVPGLINAYRTAAKDAIDNAIIIEKNITEVYNLQFTYEQMNSVMKILKDEELPQCNQKFELDCSLDFSVRQSASTRVCDEILKLKGVKLTLLRIE